MFALLRRVLGTSEEHKASEERYKKNVEDLEAREKELDALEEQFKGVNEMQKEKKEELRKTGVDLTRTLSKSLPLNTPGIKDDEQEDEDRPSGEAIPSVG